MGTRFWVTAQHSYIFPLSPSQTKKNTFSCICNRESLNSPCSVRPSGHFAVPCENESEVTYDQVWWPILGICALHLTHPKCTHTAVNTHTPWTHTRSSGQPFMLRRPGSSWGFGALLKPLGHDFLPWGLGTRNNYTVTQTWASEF